MRAIRRIGAWFYDRLRLEKPRDILFEHKVPHALSTRRGWFFAFGNATLVAFLLQVATGIALATKYVAAPDYAYDSLVFITDATFLGWLLRGLHFYGASAMVVLILVHMARVFLTGSFKYPREMGWITGVFLLGLTFAFAFTGQLLRWDQDGYWTVVVGSQFAARVPFVGDALARFILGGDTVGPPTLSRFFALHVILLPILLVGFVAVHLYLVYMNGISELPKAGRKIDKKQYRAWYEKLEEGGRPYFPFVVWREAVLGLGVVAAVFALALTFGPKALGPAPDPLDLSANPRPDWFVIWYYALLWLKPRGTETLVMVYLPLLVGAFLVLMPFLFNRGERSPFRRPLAIPLVGVLVVSFVSLIYLGLYAPWTPRFDTEPLPVSALPSREPEVIAGSRIFYERGCQYCHQVLGEGGYFGPALNDVMARTSREETAIRIVNGYGDMPAYRDILAPGELDPLLAFLASLRAYSKEPAPALPVPPPRDIP